MEAFKVRRGRLEFFLPLVIAMQDCTVSALNMDFLLHNVKVKVWTPWLLRHEDSNVIKQSKRYKLGVKGVINYPILSAPL